MVFFENTILGKEEFKKHASELATHSCVVRRDGRGASLPDWETCGEIIQKTYQRVTSSFVEERVSAMPAEEWILDNYHIIQAQLAEFELQRKQNHNDKLPVVESGGIPKKSREYRVFTIATEIVEHTDGQVDEDAVVDFVESYQKIAPLTTRELNRLGFMLKLALLQRISSICLLADHINREREEAKNLFERFASYLKMSDTENKRNSSRALEVWLSGVGDLTPVFAESILRLAAKQNEDTEAFRNILNRKLAGRGTTLDQMIAEEHQLRAALGVSMGNSITAIKNISSFDWDRLLMKLSTVEQILLKDPAGVYSRMSRDSKALYVRRIDEFAHQWKLSAESIALASVELAGGRQGKQQHVGYYICDQGIRELRKKLRKGLPPLPESGWRFGYFTLWTILSVVLAFVPSVLLARSLSETYQNVFLHIVLFLLLIPGLLLVIADFAGKLMQLLFAGRYPPVVLPALDFQEGIPEEYRVMVILPGLLSDVKRTEELLQQLEVAAYANQDPHICFALIGDFRDGPHRQEPEDTAIIQAGMRMVKRINRRYQTMLGEATDGDKFAFFYRDRTWYETEQVWMGWEKKRGAILEWNRLLLHRNSDVWKGSVEPQSLPPIRYVLTVDADTQLPSGTVTKMAEIMAHILNEPELESYHEGREKAGKDNWIVKRGYGMLQPAVVPAMSRKPQSIFTKIFSEEPGVDSYFARTSDFYFDSFQEGIFTGKGMYRPDVFNTVLEQTFPDDAVLSHDLIEGSYLRTAFVSNVKLYDQFPGNVESYMKRLHRWTRGDWQLLPFMGRTFVDRNGRKRENPLGFLSLFKMANNLTRSFLAPGMLLVFLLGRLVLPQLALFWYFFLLIPSFLPWMLAPSRRHFYNCLLNVVFLPFEAYNMLDACFRTLWRVYRSKKNLLSWVTASDAERKSKGTAGAYCRLMWPCFVAALLPPGWISLAWIAAPFVAYRISLPQRPAAQPEEALSPGQRRALGVLSRKIWAFYEDFAGEGDHFLPPDNVQFEPVYVVAHRTSPTNIGFLLVSTVIACEMGYLTRGQMLERLSKVMDTLEKMEKWKGHLYNWYDTVTLYPLEPIFISTVDSGNLMACLLCAATFLEANRSYGLTTAANGLLDLVNTLNEYALPDYKVAREPLESFLEGESKTLTEWRLVLEFYRQHTGLVTGERSDAVFWRQKLRHTLEALEQMTSALSQQPEGDSLWSEQLRQQSEALAGRMTNLAMEMDFKPLYHNGKGLFSTGYSLRDNRIADSYYDILVSEARLTSYLAIAKGDVPATHFYKMARRRAQNGEGILLSWSGTAFEYLLPEMFLEAFPGSLWDKTIDMMIDGQRRYGELMNTPWGISESGYNMMDLNMNYKYKAFGVPGLGIKRGLEEELVIAPYAAMMAIDRVPKAVMRNLERLKAEGAAGRYGYYEAVDFTKDRKGIVASYMAHHLGMSFVAIANYVLQDVVRRLFSRIPLVASCDSLIAEKRPAGYGRVAWRFESAAEPRKKRGENRWDSEDLSELPAAEAREYEPGSGSTSSNSLPDCNLLSNGEYKVFLTTNGTGYSQCGSVGVTNWIEGYDQDPCGMILYINHVDTGELWAAGRYPVEKKPDQYRVVFYPDKAVFNRWDGMLETELEVCVSSEENAEIRRVSLTNHGDQEISAEITGFVELSLAPWQDYDAHPSYSDLFVTTEAPPMEDRNCLFAVRTPQKREKEAYYSCLLLEAKNGLEGPVQFDTDLASFLGRNGDASLPEAMKSHTPLSMQHGAVLTPCFALRGRVRIRSGEKAVLSFTLGFGRSKNEVEAIADKFRYARSVDRAFELARTKCMIEAEYIGLQQGERTAFLNILPHLVYAGPSRALYSLAIYRSLDVVRGLWRFGISGELPLITVFAQRIENTAFLERMVRMWQFFSFRGFRADLAIITDENTDYMHPVRDFADFLASKALSGTYGERGGIFVITPNENMRESLDCLLAGSSIVLKPASLQNAQKAVAGKGKLYVQMWNRRLLEPAAAMQAKPESHCRGGRERTPLGDQLLFFNGYGGFHPQTGEYVILRSRPLPAPWVNCITGEHFGFVVSEMGSGAVWNGNSRENRLTPWYCRSVRDPAGEAIYIQNKETGRFFTATPAPAGRHLPYRICHGFGYSTFAVCAEGIYSQLCLFAPLELPVKISYLELENTTSEDLHLQLVYYVKPVLGASSLYHFPYTIVVWDEEKSAMLLHHFQKTVYGAMTAFAASSLQVESYTGDDVEFKGIGGDLRFPAAMLPEGLTLSCGAGGGRSPCAALQSELVLKAGEKAEIVYLLGQTFHDDQRVRILDTCRNPYHVQKELRQVQQKWRAFLNVVQVDTPDMALNLMMNGWLLYQVRSCRIEGRTAFYQSGGAFGFRDQLQDSLALLYADPGFVRNQIVLHASRQYEEGDVQHWWHPPEGAGIRSRYSDDLLWLPYVTWQYIQHTGDEEILKEEIPFLQSEPLHAQEHDRYERPEHTETTASLYEHCARAVRRSLRFGEHGLPLMGGGDWNDGMNCVGGKGKGESVWLGWFLCSVLDAMTRMSRIIGEVTSYAAESEKLAAAIEQCAWDGGWYLRAFYDDGEKLGSAANSQCIIDSLSQSWSVISGKGKRERTEIALSSAEKNLVDYERGIIKLLTPPFRRETDLSRNDPGYISAYPAGVRENGAQYTHAAVWLAKAMLLAGRQESGYEMIQMLNPVNHSRTATEANRYKTEPYVIAADVYSDDRNSGRGGWTWYTGAAGWYYRTILEDLLGLSKRGDRLCVSPRLPSGWNGYTIRYQYGGSLYQIVVRRANRPESEAGYRREIALADDGKEHTVLVETN